MKFMTLVFSLFLLSSCGSSQQLTEMKLQETNTRLCPVEPGMDYVGELFQIEDKVYFRCE